MILLRINSKGIDLPTGEVLSGVKLLPTRTQLKNMDKKGNMVFFILLAKLLSEAVFASCPQCHLIVYPGTSWPHFLHFSSYQWKGELQFLHLHF